MNGVEERISETDEDLQVLQGNGMSEAYGRCTGSYHPAQVGQQEKWKGRTWRDMPGSTFDDKRMNFVLYRRGLISEADLARDHREEWVSECFRERGS